MALNFNLFRDVQLQGMVTGVTAQSALGSVFAGHLLGIKDGRFMLAVQGDVVLGNIRAPGVGYFQIRYLGNGVHDVREIDESEFPPCATDEHDDGATPPPVTAPRGEPDDCDDDGSVIDLMVAYTAEARVAQGGTAAIEALIALSEAETNQAYANSLINSTSVRVVFTHEVDYVESGSSSTDRERMSNPDDGHMDEVPVLRDEVAADVVTLLVNDFEVCGRAFFSISAGNVPHPELGFNVVQASCSAGNFTFGHELAHNQGCRHDRQHDPSDGGAFLYSHGYIEPQGLFRTVMGVSTPGIPRIQYFSNSDVSYQGEPTGLPVGDPASAHNALTIENTAYNVANFRRSNDCNGNGICDDVELATGIAQDCNGNGLPDDCDGDCNGNGAADECDIAQGVSQDCTGNGVPDECESDCNGNGVADSCDIFNGTLADDNGDGFPDECKLPLLYVDSAAAGANNGKTWSDAFVSPHDAFALAEDPRVGVQEIWVRAGVYTPDVPNGDRTRSFELPVGVGVYGGFAGGETDLDQRDPRLHETVFSGDLNGDDDPGPNNTLDNSYHVVTVE
ncbi:MAG: hypothetical protein IH897_02605, partial [Planctomycetes bacterium]|nr:hypothetical protein [Planctomycetota bacterium]